MQETVERERYADYKKSIYLGRTVALAVRGAAPHFFGTLEDELSLAIFQTAFDPEVMKERLDRVQQAARARREEVLRDARMLARVASYSETEDDQQDQAEQTDVFARRLAERAVQKDK